MTYQSTILCSARVDGARVRTRRLFLSTFTNGAVFLGRNFAVGGSNCCSSKRFTQVTRMALHAVHCCSGRGVLGPSCMARSNTHFCASRSFTELSRVLLLGCLNFSLSSVQRVAVSSSSCRFVRGSLGVRLGLMHSHVRRVRLIRGTVRSAASTVHSRRTVS